ncbi:MAG: hypothetical protein ACD_58C00147G0005 [uncultured bacterium]|nr:MAG: hypothetical protein ACD_58C00147G0005 [uncultured bacterium]
MYLNFDFSSVKKQKIDFNQINRILEKAGKNITSARKILKTDQEGCFTVAYESMLKTTLALMLSHGYRPRIQLGHHITLVSFSKYILKEKFFAITSTYDKMRQKRNRLIYDDAFVSITEANKALEVAEKYFQIVEEKIKQENPQQKLWKP